MMKPLLIMMIIFAHASSRLLYETTQNQALQTLIIEKI